MTSDTGIYRASDHDDLMNTLPTLFGFVPRECIVGIVVSGPRCRFGFRLRHDLPDAGGESELAAALAPHLVRNGGDGVFLIALSADPERARRMVVALREALPPSWHRLGLWADDAHVWSDLPDAPPQGEPYRISDHHVARLHAIAEGQVVLDDRAELLLEVTPADGQGEDRALEEVHERAVDELVRRAVTSDGARFVQTERAAVAGLVERGLAGAELTDVELVELSVRVAPKDVRDDQWYRIDRDNARAAHALWASVARVADAEVAPAALSLAGFAAWQWGDGARALVAAEQAVRLEPDYTMARLLLDVLALGLHPDAWSIVREVA